jgi:hypothetical protein
MLFFNIVGLILKIAVSMMASSGIFRNIIPVFGAISAIYYEQVCDNVKDVINQVLQARDQAAMEHKDLLKSRSDWGILGSLRNSLRRGYGDQSKSMDSLVVAASERQGNEKSSAAEGTDGGDVSEVTPLTQSNANGNMQPENNPALGIRESCLASNSCMDKGTPMEGPLSQLLLGPVLRIVSALLAFEAHLDRLYVEAEGDFLPGTAGNTGHSTLNLARGGNPPPMPKGVLKPALSHPDLTWGNNNGGSLPGDLGGRNTDDTSTPAGDSTLNTTTTSNGNILYEFSDSMAEADSSLEDYFQLNVLPSLKVFLMIVFF